VAAYRGSPVGDGELPWLYGVARKVLGHQWRRTRRRGRFETELTADARQGAPGPERVVVMRDELERVLAAASLLGEQDQEVLRLAGWEGLSHGQIATMLGCSVATVDQRFHRAKRRLADKFRAIDATRSLRKVVGREETGGVR